MKSPPFLALAVLILVQVSLIAADVTAAPAAAAGDKHRCVVNQAYPVLGY